MRRLSASREARRWTVTHMDLLANVRQYLRQHDLIGSGARVVAALSGGSDSVALAHVLNGLESAGELRLADVVAVGHTRDDQAETFLLRLVRGAGPRGLAGMYPRNGSIVRPLLSCRRQALRDWLAIRRASGDRLAAFIEDESNRDLTIPRNRMRTQVIPLLEAVNPDIVDVLAGEADRARELWTWLEAAADALESRARADFVEMPPSTRGQTESGCAFQVEPLQN